MFVAYKMKTIFISPRSFCRPPVWQSPHTPAPLATPLVNVIIEITPSLVRQRQRKQSTGWKRMPILKPHNVITEYILQSCSHNCCLLLSLLQRQCTTIDGLRVACLIFISVLVIYAHDKSLFVFCTLLLSLHNAVVLHSCNTSGLWWQWASLHKIHTLCF